MLELFLPNEQKKSIFELKPEDLKMKGIKGLIVDLDNTLIPWNQAFATKEVKEWFQLMTINDIKLLVISNNQVDRVTTFAYPINIQYIGRAKKPLPKVLLKASKILNLKTNEVSFIREQLLTDVLCGNLVGHYTIVVGLLVTSDGPITQFNRKVESLLLERFYKKRQ